MPYLPQRRYRPAGTRAGNFSPRGSAAQSSGFQDQTMPKWLRDALAKAQGVTPASRGGPKVREAPARQAETPQEQANFFAQGGMPAPVAEQRGLGAGGGLGQGQERVDAITDAGAYVPSRGPGGLPSYQPGGFYPGGGGFAELLAGLFESLTRGGGVGQQAAGQFEGFGSLLEDRSSIAENRAANAANLPFIGNIQEFFAPEPFEAGPDRFGRAPTGPNLLEGLGNFVLPGTTNYPQPGSQGPRGGFQGFDAGRAPTGSRFLQGGESVGEAFADVLPDFPEGMTFTGAFPFGPTSMETFWQGEQLDAIERALAEAKYQPGEAPLPAFAGAGGGGGGFGGFNFAPGDPADPRFWLDMVRWLI